MPESYSIKFYNNENQVVKHTLTAGKKWSEMKTTNAGLNTIFDTIDDGDGIASADEIKYLQTKMKDLNKNGVFDNNELGDIYRAVRAGDSGSTLATLIQGDITAKTKLGLPTTGKDIGVHIAGITQVNVIDTLNEYKKIAGRNLFTAIMNEVGLDFDVRAKYCKHIFNQIFRQIKQSPKRDAIKKEFETEIARQRASVGKANGDKLNEITNKLICLTRTESTNISTQINDDVNQKNILGRRTTGNQIEDHINQINQNNVTKVLKDYKSNHDESIFTSIMNANGLMYKTKADYCRKIFAQLIKYAQSKNVDTTKFETEFNKELDAHNFIWGKANTQIIDKIIKDLNDTISYYEAHSSDDPKVKNAGETRANGKVDKPFYQGKTEDCWLISVIKGFTLSSKGQKILDDSVQVNSDGSIKVTLQGVGKSYTFSAKEVNFNNQLSRGDFEVRAIEMAFVKYFKEEGVNGRVDLNMNFETTAYKLLTGNEGTRKDKITQQDMAKFNNPNHIACVSAIGKNPLEYTTPDGQKYTLSPNHAYTVARSDNKYVYIINPYNTTKEVPVDKETFMKYFNDLECLDL